MAKGAVAKQEIFEKMLEMFEGSFIYNNGKELRIPWDENGVELQIKVALTCAKDIVSKEAGSEAVKVAATKGAAAPKEEDALIGFPVPRKKLEPTPEEKQNIEDLLISLGLQ